MKKPDAQFERDIVEWLRFEAGEYAADTVPCRRLDEAANLIAEMLVVLNLCRIMLKNRDQRPEEMKLLDAIKIVIAKAEGPR